MDYAVQVAIYALLAVAALWIVISAAGALPLLMLAKVNMVKLEADAARPWLQKVIRLGVVEPQWLSDQRFEPRGVYQAPGQVGDPHFVVWQRAGERSYICVYIVMKNRVEIDLITMFDNGGLTTGTTKDGLTIPGRPGHWMQAFPVRVVDQLWKYHEDALAFLKQTTGQRPSTQAIDFADEFMTSVRGHVAYVRTIPLWFLRIPYWYFVRRTRLNRQTVQQQYENYGLAAASMDGARGGVS
jgi:hypothetical protein